MQRIKRKVKIGLLSKSRRTRSDRSRSIRVSGQKKSSRSFIQIGDPIVVNGETIVIERNEGTGRARARIVRINHNPDF